MQQNDHSRPISDRAPVEGGCLCGAIRYSLVGRPRVHYCHCDMCRRATGSAFAVLAWIPISSLTWTKSCPTYRRSSPIAQRGFCPGCGTPLTLVYDNGHSEIALHAGTLDDPNRFPPQYNYGSPQRLGWVCCGVDLPDRNSQERW
jgi:hypothetical protein